MYIYQGVYTEGILTVDQLTGLPGKKVLMEALSEAIATDESLTFAMLDIDGFMQVNDTLGHESGDTVVATVGHRLRRAAETKGWVVARTGGDEFGICLPGIPLERGFLLMEELRQEITAELRAGVASELGLGVSIGVANSPRDAKDAPALFRKADQALYQAKEAGRNQVALPWSEEMVMRSCYYTTTQVSRIKRLAEGLKRKESVLLREALDDLLRKYDRLRADGT
jgi:diguanylate cyclase (GGDEF)-like protein